MLTKEQFRAAVWRGVKRKRQCLSQQPPPKPSETKRIGVQEVPRSMPSMPLTVGRAKQIVEYAESEFASGQPIQDAFLPFEKGGATNRLEALCALYLVIADFYRFASTPKELSMNAMHAFEQYSNHSRHMSVRIFTDGLLDEKQIKERGINQISQHDSNVAYIKSLDPSLGDFWPLVYERIGLRYPIGDESSSKDNFVQIRPQDSPPKNSTIQERFKRIPKPTKISALMLVLLGVAFFIAADFDNRWILIPIMLYAATFLYFDIRKKSSTRGR